MDLTIQQLRMLREVSRQGTIGRAAETLGYTPSAVSQQLSTAEKSAGVSVLERVGRNVVLTDAGRELVMHAEIVLSQLDKAQAAIERVQGEVAGEFHVGFVESIGSTMLEPIMVRLRRDHPGLKLRTVAVDGISPERMILNGELNVSFAVGYGPEGLVPAEGCARETVCRDAFRFVGPSDEFGDRVGSTIDLATVGHHEFIAPPADDACGQAVLLALKESEVDPLIAHRVSDYPTTLRLVAAGVGVALVPNLGLTTVPKGVAVVDLARPTDRSIELVYRSSSADRPIVRAFIDAVSAVAGDLSLA